MADGLRISGGSRRGRKLLSPPPNSIRPASDFVRQAVFNMLSRWTEGSVFYDVFAGTGIVGIEALSRGARQAIFVERDRQQLDLIRRNLARVRFGPEAKIRGTNAFTWAKHFWPDEEPTIVFLGPPYPLFEEDIEGMLKLVETLQSRLADAEDVSDPSIPARVLVLQYPRSLKPEQLPDADGWTRSKRYGKTRIGIWVPHAEISDESAGAETAGADDETAGADAETPVEGIEPEESSREPVEADDGASF